MKLLSLLIPKHILQDNYLLHAVPARYNSFSGAQYLLFQYPPRKHKLFRAGNQLRGAVRRRRISRDRADGNSEYERQAPPAFL